MVSNNAINNTIQDNDFSVNRATAATTAKSSVNHSDNTNTGSHASLEAISGGASGGDPFVHLQVSGTTEFSLGIDNSDSDILKLTTGASPSAGTEMLTVDQSANESIWTTYAHGTISTRIGSTVNLVCQNPDNTDSGSDARIWAAVGGASAGDPYFRVSTSTTEVGQSYTWGADNSDSDKLKITDGLTPSAGTTFWTMTNAGERTMPTQPAFLAFNTATDTNVTGNGTVYTVICNSEVYDQNSDYNNATGVFTASVTGRYFLKGRVTLVGITAATGFTIQIITSNRTYTQVNNRTTGSGNITFEISDLCDMDATDTATITISSSGEGADNDDVLGDASLAYTVFSGNLAC